MMIVLRTQLREHAEEGAQRVVWEPQLDEWPVFDEPLQLVIAALGLPSRPTADVVIHVGDEFGDADVVVRACVGEVLECAVVEDVDERLEVV